MNVSALLPGPDGKVRGDNDHVFSIHPARDGVTIAGSAVGLGRGKLAFYKDPNASASAIFTNGAFYDTSENPGCAPGGRPALSPANPSGKAASC
ncbi:hypothetical protein ACIQMV_38130 [Streptomyces sp. NPDC091412]|uniref:hypothetical protein n=1 Tax=Streptomyces sp. NPDC091412 TaxID=3366002 RepID=UPI0037F675C8